MSRATLTSHIAHQILDPSLLLATASTQTIIRAKPRLIYVSKGKKASTSLSDDPPQSPDHSKDSSEQLARPTQPPPPLPSPSQPSPISPSTDPGISISQLIDPKILILPKRLSNFLSFISSLPPCSTSSSPAQYAQSFHSATTDLAILESISLLPPSQGEQEIQTWIQEQVPELESVFEGVKEGDKNAGLYERIMLETTIGGVQIGLLMGVGILRSALRECGLMKDGVEGKGEGQEEVSGSGSEKQENEKERGVSGERKRLEEWILEGEGFVGDLEVLKEVIRERYGENRGSQETRIESDRGSVGEKDCESRRGSDGSMLSFVSVGEGVDESSPLLKE
ncbi:hypothetical protein EG329_011463 [Mollisiaceae sp. DMI_Dod_QoI]|nr:hypothetical protein EG329_011463 [Helotiales sp. DMI_Dod_QoI]